MSRVVLTTVTVLAVLGGTKDGGAGSMSSPAGSAVVEWQGGPLRSVTGEQVTVYVSTAYAPEQVPPQRWADFFAGLLHGPELATLVVRVATGEQVAALCGGSALGCYGSGELVMIGEPNGGMTPEQVAAHEYGHHIAANRLNPPWRAVDWGTKRWATAEGICERVRAGTAFPADGGDRYRLNPGEGFAEAYRVLSERRLGVGAPPWSLVDGSFFPDADALRALEQDVTAPWTRSTVRGYRTRFAPGSRRWVLKLSGLLDGEIVVRMKLPPGRLDELELLRADGGKVLARGLWTGVAEKRLSLVACGRRQLLLRVTRKGPGERVDVTVSRP